MKAAIFLANGFEQLEALGVVDILKRGKVDLVTVGLNDDDVVVSSHGLMIKADLCFRDFVDEYRQEDYEAFIFPGGVEGAKNLSENTELVAMANNIFEKGKYLCAICAAPGLFLSLIEGLEQKKFTCYPSFEKSLVDLGAYYTGNGVEVDANLITGKGPAYALDFGFAILEHLKGADVVKEVKKAMLFI